MHSRTAPAGRRRRTAPSVLALAGLALATSAAAHDGDPKLRDRQPAYRGEGWRQATTRGGGPMEVGSPVQFTASGVTMLSWLTLDDFGVGAASGNDCWGYTSPSGREYALMGLNAATSFVEISDPTNPQIIATIGGVDSLWRDVKTYGSYAYSVSEGGGGIQVFDLSNIDGGVVNELASVTSGPGTSASHNVAIDTTSGYLYRCGGSDEGLRIYSLANPAAPTYVGEWGDRYVHDAQVVTYTSGPYAGKQIAYVCGGFNGGWTETSMDVLDVTNKNNIQVLKRVFWSGAAYSHQAWLSEDLQYLYVNDELDEQGAFNTKTIVIDVSDPGNAFYETAFYGTNTAVGHNLYTAGGQLYEANYRSGLRVFDTASNPTSPAEIAYFDTYPEDDAASTSALWSVYPYFQGGVVIGSDLEKGLFVWYVGDPKIQFEFPNGVPLAVDPGGEAVQVRMLEANAGDLDQGSARLYYDYGTGYQSVALSTLGGDLYEAQLPPLPCGSSLSFYVSALSVDGLVWNAPDLAEAAPFTATIGIGEATVASFDMEQTAGWSSGDPSDDATTGIWERVNPIGTSSAPDDDHSPGTNGRAWVTGQGSSGGSLGENDVDNGKTTLLSPILDLSGTPGAQVRYWRWYDNGGNGVQDDVFDVDVSNDGGSAWVAVERIGPTGAGTSGGWIEHRFAIGDFVLPTNQVRVRFVARDTGNGSIVEAGIDDFSVVDLGCADCDGNGIADGSDVLAGAADIDGDFVPDVCVPLVGAPPTLSMSAGGTHSLSLNAGAAYAGDTYIVLGSATGTSPGVPLDSVVLPLVVDAYTTATLTGIFLPPFFGTFGLLDGAGAANAAITVPAGSDPSLAGFVLHHAYPVIDGATGKFVFASNPVTVTLVP